MTIQQNHSFIDRLNSYLKPTAIFTTISTAVVFGPIPAVAVGALWTGLALSQACKKKPTAEALPDTTLLAARVRTLHDSIGTNPNIARECAELSREAAQLKPGILAAEIHATLLNIEQFLANQATPVRRRPQANLEQAEILLAQARTLHASIGSNRSLARDSATLTVEANKLSPSPVKTEIQNILNQINTFLRNQARVDFNEKKATPVLQAPRVEREGARTVVGQINQYGQGEDAISKCTSCAGAFIQNIKAGFPLTAPTIHKSIEDGGELHREVVRRFGREANANYNAQEIIAALNRREKKPKETISSRPTSLATAAAHYKANIIPGFLDPARREGDLTCAIFTKAPYSAAIACRHLPNNQKEFIFFDSHGDEETNNKAFLKTFNDADSLCNYLANKYGYMYFDDVDYDIETKQDNPNLYSLNFF